MTPSALRKHLGRYTDPIRVVMETGGQSAWVSQLAEELGHEVIIANARDLQAVTGGTRRSDRQDAKQLARLGRLDPELLRPVTLRGRSEQIDLCVIRTRAGLVEIRSKMITMMRSMAKQFGYRLPSSSTENFVGRTREAIPAELRAALEPLLESIETVSQQIGACEAHIATAAETKYRETRWMTQVHGVGVLTALTFRLTLGDGTRFQHSRDVGAYLGLTPKRRQSGEQDPELGISKAGDRYLRKLLVQCAHHMIGRWGQECALRDWALKRIAGSRRNKKRIVVAIARKLAVLLHRLWQRQQTFQPYPVDAAAAA